MKVLALCLIFLTSCSSPQSEISFCEIMQTPEKFEGQLIKVKAVYIDGFEASSLYSLQCSPKKRVWVERVEKKCENAGKVEDFIFPGMANVTYGVSAVGRLTEKKDGYGYMNSYNYLFKVECFDKAEMLYNERDVPKVSEAEQHRRIEEFEREN